MAPRIAGRAPPFDRPGSVKSAKGRSAAARLLLLLLLLPLKRPPSQLKSNAFLTLPHIAPRAEAGALSDDEDADADAPLVVPASGGGACDEGGKRGGVV